MVRDEIPIFMIDQPIAHDQSMLDIANIAFSYSFSSSYRVYPSSFPSNPDIYSVVPQTDQKLRISIRYLDIDLKYYDLVR